MEVFFQDVYWWLEMREKEENKGELE